jgi:hypothetical protein
MLARCMLSGRSGHGILSYPKGIENNGGFVSINGLSAQMIVSAPAKFA